MGTVKHVRCSTCGAFMGKASITDETEERPICADCKVKFNELRLPGKTATAIAEPSFQCPRCRATSHNPNDVAQSYCSSCKIFFTGSIIGARKIMVDMQQLKQSLLAHADGLITSQEFNTLVGAIHDMQVLLEGVIKFDAEKK